MNRFIPLIFLLFPNLVRADAKAEAQTLFEQGRKDMEAHNYERACKELAASLEKKPDAGTRGALAECYSGQGKITSAWRLWKRLVDSAPTLDLKADALKNAAALEPRLPRFVLKIGGTVAGLSVTLNGDPVADLTLSVPLPIDPGPIIAVARAPGRQDWTQTYQAIEGKTTTIEIPELSAAPVRVEGSKPTKRWAYLTGGVGLAAVATGLGFGLNARSKYNEAHSNGRCDAATICDDAGFALVNRAHTSATVSTILVSVGVAGVAVGTYLYLRSPKHRMEATSMHVVPMIGDRAVGAMVMGGL